MVVVATRLTKKSIGRSGSRNAHPASARSQDRNIETRRAGEQPGPCREHPWWHGALANALGSCGLVSAWHSVQLAQCVGEYQPTTRPACVVHPSAEASNQAKPGSHDKDRAAP
eukprot:scaffold29029_cov54-Phaeocystis_antarctica.AAC.3